jgi:diguanylate cyclase (GGDEF)-like protein
MLSLTGSVRDADTSLGMGFSDRAHAAAGSHSGGDTPGGRLTIGRRLGLLVGLLGVAIAVVTTIGALGVGRVDRLIHDFYTGTFNQSAITVELRGSLKSTEIASLEYALVENPARRKQLQTDLTGTLIPAVNAALAAAEAELGAASHGGATQAALRRVRARWQLYLEREGPALFATNAAGEQAAAIRIRSLLERIIRDAEILADGEAAQASAEIRDVSAFADSTLRELMIAALIAGLIGFAIAIVLTRSIVRRTRDYSHFAAGVAAGSYGERVKLRGNDELTELGELLNRMVEHRDAEQSQGRQRSEFTEAMQLTGDEGEAHNLLKQHLERSIPGSVVTVLSRNNSADRLVPTTPLAPEDPIAEGLSEAQPRDCLAVRSGQAHRSEGDDALLACKICGEATMSACQPLLVGGEVIGAVLARRDRGLGDSESETMRSSVIQAAPLLANLRNLALAELRAGTDALTGLPNQRASHETMQRMVAQADRAGQPLSVLLLDLDHFKQINDVFGHAEGDNVLAAVGVSLRSTIREGDFCGRFGGEEFVVLLPNTDSADAGLVAEKIRVGVEAIRVPSVRREITISIGAATVPDHGTDAATVSRIADRALYAAKAGGRNRVELARAETIPAEADLALDAEAPSR